MGITSRKPEKLKDPLQTAKQNIKSGNYIATYHAKIRQIERLVPLPDVLNAIEKGYHEKKRDRFDSHFRSWSYSIRGKTTDKRNIRVIVSFDDFKKLLIITVVVLKGSGK